jgi:hypothetical protein
MVGPQSSRGANIFLAGHYTIHLWLRSALPLFESLFSARPVTKLFLHLWKF